MISVIIPVYNVEAFLPACLESVIRQSYAGLEIILVDDGSTDSCPAICDAYAARDARIRVIHQQNRGLSAARNAGIEAASGEYISFVDSDDFILPGMLEHLLEQARRHDADYVQCGYVRCREEDTIAQIILPDEVESVQVFEDAYGKMKSCIRGEELYISAWGKLFSRGLFRNIRFPEGKVYEDVSFTLQAIHSARKIIVSFRTGYVYRSHSGSITNTHLIAQSKDYIDACMFAVSFCEENYPDLLLSARAHLISACNKTVLKMARYKQWDGETGKKLKQLYCRYFSLKIEKPLTRPSKLFALLARSCYPAAKLAARLIVRLKNP